MSADRASAQWGGEISRIRVSPPLPCGIKQCGRSATQALVEDDQQRPALWMLLPICDKCAAQLAKRPN